MEDQKAFPPYHDDEHGGFAVDEHLARNPSANGRAIKRNWTGVFIAMFTVAVVLLGGAQMFKEPICALRSKNSAYV